MVNVHVLCVRRLCVTSIVAAMSIFWATHVSFGSDVIDFESLGLSEGDTLSMVTTASNTVGFASDLDNFVNFVEVGSPRTAFSTEAGGQDNLDVPSNIGQFFVTESNGPASIFNDDYLFTFAIPVLDFGLDLYDPDPTIQQLFTLTVFSDTQMLNAIGSQSFLAGPFPVGDGTVLTYFVEAPQGQTILSAFLDTNGVNGTGIDNVAFTTIPEPSTLTLAALAHGHRRRRA